MARKSGFGKLVAGIAIGAGLGVLFAPKSGEETRKELKVKFDEVVGKIKELDAQEVKESLTKKIDDIKKEVADLDKEKVASIAKAKAGEIKDKLDDLYEEAKEKATPVIQNSIDELRKRTVVFLKGTIKKIEKPKKEVKE